MSTSCKCAADALVFFTGANMAMDTIQNIPSLFRAPMAAELESSDKATILKKCIDFMLIGAVPMPHDCPIDTGETVKSLYSLKLRLDNIDDRELRNIFDELSRNMHLAVTDCLIIEQSVLAEEDIPEQLAALSRLGTYRLIKRHDDGDMTVQTAEGKFMVDTHGEVFKEVSFGG